MSWDDIPLLCLQRQLGLRDSRDADSSVGFSYLLHLFFGGLCSSLLCVLLQSLP